MGKNLLFFIVTLFVVIKGSAQCGQTETIVICDMDTIDSDNSGPPDGIINLYQEYTSQIGGVLPVGTWFDPGFNFALNEATGELLLWDLDDSTATPNPVTDPITYYEFQLFTAACGTSVPAYTIQLNLGPFEGNPLPPSGINAANVTICEAGVDSFDLFQVFESLPSPHQNGVWAFLGKPRRSIQFYRFKSARFF